MHSIARLAVLVAIQIPSLLPSQAGGWALVSSSGPPGRRGHGMVFDSHRGSVLVFGGTHGGLYLGDTWEWNGSTWNQVSSSGPPGRFSHGMVYDSGRNRTVMFGGANGVELGDTWEWDGSTWTQVASTGPTPRTGHSIVYDPIRQRTVLFGGHDNTNQDKQDTWEWTGAAWQPQLFFAGPTARQSAAATFDAIRGAVILTGGIGNGVLFADTWAYDSSGWHGLSSFGPARQNSACAFNSGTNRTVLYGGEGMSGTTYDDTREWDGATWTTLPPQSANPPPLHFHRMVFDEVRQKVFLFGGIANRPINGGETNEAYYSAGEPSTATVFGAGCGVPPLSLTPAAPPQIGSTAQASIGNMPSTLAFVALGFNTTQLGPFSLPLPLDGFGLPGCVLLHSAEAAAEPVTATGPGAALYNLPIPNSTSLVRLRIHLQGWALAPTANAAQMIVSNGITWTIGSP